MKVKNNKNKRVKICDIRDLNKALNKEGYNIKISDYEDFKEFFVKNFNITDKLFNEIYKVINEKIITYKVNDVNDFIMYINNSMIFEEEHKILCEKISNIKVLNINRVEYDRTPSAQDDVEHILKIIKNHIINKKNSLNEYKGNLFYKKMQPQYPNLIDAFPYNDIKNDISDISTEFYIEEASIVPMENNQSYLWKTPCKVIKQYYNRFNYKQEWNTYDPKQVIPLMSLYDAAVFSSSLTGFLPITERSDVLFSYIMPAGRVLTNDESLKEMPLLLKKLREPYTETSYDETDLSETNSKFQFQHKYYTIQALVKELNTAMENHPIFNASEVNCTKSIFNKITHIRTQIPSKYGMNYGKSILNHIVQSNVQTFLLPSCDIYFGETGIDEAYTYMEYYGDSILEPLNSQKLQLIDNTVLLWIGVLLIEQYIENKILHKKCKIELSSISNFYDGFFETVLLLI